ncbi:MAG: hypothetical protein V1822_00870 [Candidatus Micrarchaeota archaeon]
MAIAAEAKNPKHAEQKRVAGAGMRINRESMNIARRYINRYKRVFDDYLLCGNYKNAAVVALDVAGTLKKHRHFNYMRKFAKDSSDRFYASAQEEPQSIKAVVLGSIVEKNPQRAAGEAISFALNVEKDSGMLDAYKYYVIGVIADSFVAYDQVREYSRSKNLLYSAIAINKYGADPKRIQKIADTLGKDTRNMLDKKESILVQLSVCDALLEMDGRKFTQEEFFDEFSVELTRQSDLNYRNSNIFAAAVLRSIVGDINKDTRPQVAKRAYSRAEGMLFELYAASTGKKLLEFIESSTTYCRDAGMACGQSKIGPAKPVA